MAGSRQALVGAGSNLGDRRTALAGAVAELRRTPGIAAVAASPIYETEPVGVTGQPFFLNMALGVETTLAPEELLAALLAVEKRFGRERRGRWGPRTLDLDLLAFEGETRTTPELELPHPRMLERAFVTVPLRALLAGEQFGGAAWRDLRACLDALPRSAEGVRKIHAEIH